MLQHATHVFVASVVPKASKILARIRPDAVFLHGDQPLPIPLNYPRPREIGADRLANAIALHKMGKFPAIAVDFGTAITLDILDARGAYCGGVIAPGWQLMLDYLHEKTALLPAVKLTSKPNVIGRSTNSAIRSGVFYGFVGLVIHLLEKVSATLSEPPQIVLATGGDCAWISEKVPHIQAYDPMLTLRGLKIFGDFHTSFVTKK